MAALIEPILKIGFGKIFFFLFFFTFTLNLIYYLLIYLFIYYFFFLSISLHSILIPCSA
jgi:hypothetical protein